MIEKKPHICICICTYKRPKLLKRLLVDLGRQKTEGQFTYSIVVAENDASQAARETVAEVAGSSSIPITYCMEPRQNIALARNKALSHAKGDFIAFIDDDEFPSERWLLTMLQACNKYGVDGVLGPVLAHFGDSTPRWVVRSGLFDRPSLPTGTVLNSAQTRTGNVLMKTDMLAGDDLPFDPEFLAGSDQVFFKKMMNKGRVFIWSHEGIVYEEVPPNRWSPRFLMRRAVFRGVFSKRLHGSSPLPFAASFAAVLGYAILFPVSVFLGKARSMKCAFKLCYHVGRLLALVGINPIKAQYVSD